MMRAITGKRWRGCGDWEPEMARCGLEARPHYMFQLFSRFACFLNIFKQKKVI